MNSIKKRKVLWIMGAVALLLALTWFWPMLTRGPIHRGNVEALCKAIKPGMTETEVVKLLGGPDNSPKVWIPPPSNAPLNFTTADFVAVQHFACGLRFFDECKSWGEDYRFGINVHFDWGGRVTSSDFWVGPTAVEDLWQRVRTSVGLK